MDMTSHELPDPLVCPTLVLGVDCSDVEDGGELLVQSTLANST